ncbi:Transposase, Mutator family [compost metagenome]
MGIDEKGIRQILGFYVGGNESSNGWREVLKDLKKRGATDVLLGVFDGLPGLEEAFNEIYPKADVQHCVIHKVRATFPKIRVADKTDFSVLAILNLPLRHLLRKYAFGWKNALGKRPPRYKLLDRLHNVRS